MGIVNSRTGEQRKYGLEELREAALELRAYDLLAFSRRDRVIPGARFRSWTSRQRFILTR